MRTQLVLLRGLGLLLTLLAAGGVAASVFAAQASAAPPVGDGDGGFQLTPVARGSKGMIDVGGHRAFPRGLFVARQGGRIRVIRNGKVRRAPFVDFSRRVRLTGEEGLLSLAFHPHYGRNRLLYVYFTNRAGNNVVMELKRDRRRPFRVDRSSARRVLLIRHPHSERHNGGRLAFGPDGFLYLSTGDGGTLFDREGFAQSPRSLFGKLLRIDPRRVRRCPNRRSRRLARRAGMRCGRRPRPYTSPRGNPFAGANRGRPEVYALGFRNPFRFSFDSATGAISIGDVGEGCLEEVDYRRRGRARGANFGWSRFEGSQLFNPEIAAPGAIPPIFEYGHNHPPPGIGCYEPPTDHWGRSVIMGHVVRDPRLRRQYGRLLFSDWVNGDIRTLIPREGGAQDERSTGVTIPGGAISFGEGPNRLLYAISTTGSLYRLDPAG